MHGTGHALGREVHENPRFNALSEYVVEPGMVLTVEPGLYYPAVGGVRIEDVIVFHPDGQKENITHFNSSFFV
jgi:Xaa-Pro aminopeptidase